MFGHIRTEALSLDWARVLLCFKRGSHCMNVTNRDREYELVNMAAAASNICFFLWLVRWFQYFLKLKIEKSYRKSFENLFKYYNYMSCAVVKKTLLPSQLWNEIANAHIWTGTEKRLVAGTEENEERILKLCLKCFDVWIEIIAVCQNKGSEISLLKNLAASLYKLREVGYARFERKCSHVLAGLWTRSFWRAL